MKGSLVRMFIPQTLAVLTPSGRPSVTVKSTSQQVQKQGVHGKCYLTPTYEESTSKWTRVYSQAIPGGGAFTVWTNMFPPSLFAISPQFKMSGDSRPPFAAFSLQAAATKQPPNSVSARARAMSSTIVVFDLSKTYLAPRERNDSRFWALAVVATSYKLTFWVSSLSFGHLGSISGVYHD